MRTYEPSEMTKQIVEALQIAAQASGVKDKRPESTWAKLNALLKKIQDDKLDVRFVTRDY